MMSACPGKFAAKLSAVAKGLFWIALSAMLFGYLIALFAGEARVTMRLVPHYWLQFADAESVDVAVKLQPESATVNLVAWSRPAYGSVGFIPGVGSLSGASLVNADQSYSRIAIAAFEAHPILVILPLGMAAFWVVARRIRGKSPPSPRIRRRFGQALTTASASLLVFTIAGSGLSATLGKIEIEAEAASGFPSPGAKSGDVCSRGAAIEFTSRSISISVSATKFKDWYGISRPSVNSRSFLGLVSASNSRDAEFDRAQVSVHSALAIGVFALLPVIAYIRRRRDREAHPRCRDCGYNLTGNVTGRCPECGSVIVSHRLGGRDQIAGG